MIHKIPQYRYSFFKQWDKKTFALIKKIAQAKNYPKIVGGEEEKNQFLVMLIRSQKSLHGWRKFLVDTMKQVEENHSINIGLLVRRYSSKSVTRNRPAWVTYKEDKIVFDFIDKLATKKVVFVGTNREISEFTMRFISGQLGHDWEWTIMMIWEMLGSRKRLIVKELNREMRNFDYLKLFE
ncbi:MAG: hypothetical protein WC862_02145 [Patescibacteria group bacterium]